MTNVERLQRWLDEEKGKGLIDVDFFLSPTKESSVEEICGSVLKVLDNKDKGLYTRLASVQNT